MSIQADTRDTKDKILDAAEHLFAREGFHGTSLRAITGTAGVNLASVNYHFGSKESLMEAVLERRLTPLNRARLEMLGRIRGDAPARGAGPEARDVMRAFIEPTLRFRDTEPGAEDFILLVSRAFNEPDGIAHRSFLRLLVPVLETFYGALREACPEIPDKVLVGRFRLAIGTMAHTLHYVCDTEQLPGVFRHACEMATEEMLDTLIDFVTAGIIAPVRKEGL